MNFFTKKELGLMYQALVDRVCKVDQLKKELDPKNYTERNQLRDEIRDIKEILRKVAKVL